MFTGWTYEGVSSPEKSVTVDKGSFGNKTFKANFEFALEVSGDAIVDVKYSFTYSLVDFVVPSEVDGVKITQIAENAFSWCENLETVVIEEGIENIGYHAFFYCKKLESVKIPDSVSVIYTAFRDCTALKSVIFGKKSKLTNIDEWTFSGCENLSEISLPNGVSYIGQFAFSDCKSLTSIKLSNRLTEIRYKAFSGCSSLKTVVIPHGVTVIDHSAFSGCTSLESAYIPSSVLIMGGWVFENCPKLTIYCTSGTNTYYWEYNWNPDKRSVVWKED